MVTRFLVNWIDKVEVTAPDTVVFHAKKPTPMAISYLSGVTPVYPKGHYDKAPTVERNGKKVVDYGAVMPACVGPYKLKDFKSGKEFTLERNDDYFAGSPKGKPSIKYLKYQSVTDTQAQLAGLLTGNIDWIWNVPSENAEQLKKMGKVSVESAATMRMSFLMLDAVGKAGDSPDQEQAGAPGHELRHRSGNACQEARGRGRDRVEVHVPSLADGVHGRRAAVRIQPEKAKALLKEAGYPDGFSFKLYAYRDRPCTEAVMNYLRAAGIQPGLEFLQWSACPDHRGRQDPGVHYTWGSQAITDSSASTSNFYTFSPDDYARDEKLKDILVKADMITDEAERVSLYKQALTIIAENAYGIPLFSYGRTWRVQQEPGLPGDAGRNGPLLPGEVEISRFIARPHRRPGALWRQLMRNFAFKKIALTIFVLLCLSVLSLPLMHLSGDTAIAIAGEGASQQDVERIRHEYGLDAPLTTQYLNWAEISCTASLPARPSICGIGGVAAGRPASGPAVPGVRRAHHRLRGGAGPGHPLRPCRRAAGRPASCSARPTSCSPRPRSWCRWR